MFRRNVETKETEKPTKCYSKMNGHERALQSRGREELEKLIAYRITGDPNAKPIPDRKGTVLAISALCQIIVIITGILVERYLVPEMPWHFLWLTYFIGIALGGFVHYLGHQRWFWRRWYRAHVMGHHIDNYPAKHFLRDYVAYNPDNNDKYYYPLLPIPCLLSLYFFGCWMPGIVATVHYLGWLIVAAIMHEAYHYKGSWFERFEWFMYMRKVHYFHHNGDMNKNFGMFDMIYDMLAGVLMLGV